jgi:hypothetical protein
LRNRRSNVCRCHQIVARRPDPRSIQNACRRRSRIRTGWKTARQRRNQKQNDAATFEDRHEVLPKWIIGRGSASPQPSRLYQRPTWATSALLAKASSFTQFVDVGSVPMTYKSWALSILTNEGPISRMQGAARLYRHLPLGHAVGLVAEPAGDGWLSVELRVVKNGAEVSRSSAVGRHVVGDVLNNQARPLGPRSNWCADVAPRDTSRRRAVSHEMPH